MYSLAMFCSPKHKAEERIYITLESVSKGSFLELINPPLPPQFSSPPSKTVPVQGTGGFPKLGSRNHREHTFTRDETGLVYLPTQLERIHYNFTGDGKCNERGWACTPHTYQPGLILPSRWNVRQKAAFATLCTL